MPTYAAYGSSNSRPRYHLRQLEIKQPAELGWSIVFCHGDAFICHLFRCVSGDPSTADKTSPAGEGEGRFTGIRRVVRGSGQFVVGDVVAQGGDQAADIPHRIPEPLVALGRYRLSSAISARSAMSARQCSWSSSRAWASRW